ncbi:MAG TPA: hypothetical protein VGZ48_01905 [Candidatus Acidoferrales bacterium]|jgi:hypothetical protein|nr:hypothetical protein [Candidatus Acidoferrales bacterium]
MTVYTRKWKEYELARRDWLLGFTSLPIAIIVLLLTHAPRLLFFWVLSIAAFAIWQLTKRLVSWPCPRCGKPFGKRGPETKDVSWYLLTIFAKKCGNCGLQEFASAAEEPAAPATN